MTLSYKNVIYALSINKNNDNTKMMVILMTMMLILSLCSRTYFLLLVNEILSIEHHPVKKVECVGLWAQSYPPLIATDYFRYRRTEALFHLGVTLGWMNLPNMTNTCRNSRRSMYMY